MKHFRGLDDIQFRVSEPPVTYDSPHSVTLTLKEWDDIQMHLGFHAHNLAERNAVDSSVKVYRLVSLMRDQTDAALSAAADTAEGE